ncbi:MAG: hypothetical protein OEW58_05095, partial [Gammaproteobacteria bacterium]|nr:hypothetical protein [Gammaproteobacteria bacterium]
NFNDSKPQYLLNNKNKLTRDSVCLLEHSSWYPDDNDAINNILNNSSNFLDLDPGNGEFLIHSLKCHKHIQSFYTGNNNEPISTNLTINKIKVSRATHVDNVLFLKERIDFVKISSSENVRLLLSYISHNKSTIPNTIYLQRNGLITESIYNEFKEFGYDIYQHIPVSNAFSPSTLSQIEAENNNSVYLIHKNKVTNFVSTGFILSDSTGLHNNKDWRTDLSSISPPLSEYISEWISLEQNSEYITGLNYLISALDSNTSPADKYTQSLQAYKNIISGVKYEPNLPRLFTCCRAALELGLHNNALEIISIALEILINNKTIDINEPFVATNKEYDNIKPNGDLYQWCLASALSSYLTTLHPVYTDTSDKEIPLIQLMDSLPFHSDKMDLRIISMRNKTSTVSVEIKDIDKSTQTINNEIAAIYHLARTGGTLISKCIACIPGNFLLSEINPSFSVANPAEQAQSWFDIFSKNEFEELLKETNYENIITEIRNRVSKNGGKLIIRDWTHIDFTGIPFTTPSYQLKQKNSLGNLFNLHDIATVRHPIDSYLSLNNLKIVNGRISVKSYLEGANKFAIEAKNIGFIRYEDFCHSPDDILKRICKSLNIFYSDEYKTNFYKYERITGETTGGRSSDTIKVPKRPNIQPALEKEFKENPLYWDTLEILGYDS